MNRCLQRVFLATVFVLTFVAALPAAQRHWVGTGTGIGRNWNQAANWSLTQGGAGGAGVPTAADDVFIDGGGNIRINTAAVCLSFTQTINAGTKDFTNNMSLTVGAGGISLAGGTLGSSTINNTINVAGDWIQSGGAFTAGTIVVVFNGTSPQTVNVTSPFAGLTINSSGGVSLASNVTVTGALTLTSGVVSAGTSTLTVSSSGSVSRTGGWVNGNLQLPVATGATSLTFHVGNATNYTPVAVSFGNVTTSGSLTGKATAGDHPSLGTSSIDGSKSVNRYYTLTNGGTVFNNYSATFNFVAGDVDGGANTANFVVGDYNAPNWTLPTVGTKTGTSTQATGLTTFSDFAIGDVKSFTITATAGANGSITPSGSIPVTFGGSQSFTIAANATYHIGDVLVDGVSQGAVASYNFPSVSANHTIAASFLADTVTITASAGANGSISPSGLVKLAAHGNQSFTMTPNAHYHVSDLVVDGVSVGAVTSYDFTDVIVFHVISASFAIDTDTITATAGANGSISPSGATIVIYGTDTTFTITPAVGYHTLDVLVDGVTVGVVPTYTFTGVVANHTISASFAINTYSLVSTAGAHGTISPLGKVTVNYGDNQPYTLTPDTGYHVADILLDGISAGATTSFTLTNVTANHTVDASFAIDTLTITASAGAHGTITPSGAVLVTYGASQSFTVTADAGYHVADLVVDGGSVGATGSYDFTGVTANRTISATFSINQFSVVALADSHGTISPSGKVFVDSSADQVFTITPDVGYFIADVHVDTVSVGAVPSYTLTNVVANHTIQASFAIQTFAVNGIADAHGTISPSGTSLVNYGSDKTFTITADTGYVIADVHVDSVSVGAVPTYTFTNVTATHVIEATFAVQTFTVNAIAGAHGSISPSGAVSVNYGSDQSFTITPDTGYMIADVHVDSVSVGAVPKYTFTHVTGNHSIEASFVVQTFVITSTAGPNGNVSPSGGIVLSYGADTSITITPDAHYHVDSLIVDGVSIGSVAKYTFPHVTSNHTLHATFAIDQNAITAISDGNGAVSPSGVVLVNYGSGQSFTITPNVGYFISDVHVDSISVGPVPLYTFTNVTAPHVIEATFAIQTFIVKGIAGANGSISPSGDVTLNYGADQSFTITPDSGYFTADVHVDSVSVGGVPNYTFTHVTANHTIEASFALHAFTVFASAGPHGTIAPGGPVPAASGGSIVFNITPDSAYYVADVHVDSVSVGAVSEYTFTNILADHTIQAFFDTHPFPQFKTMSPQTAYRGQSVDLVLTGVNFVSGVSTLNVGAGITVNSFSVHTSDTILATVTVGAGTAPGSRPFTVTNSAPGGGTSGPVTFTVLNHAPGAFSLAEPFNGDTIKLKSPAVPIEFKWHPSADLDVADTLKYIVILQSPSHNLLGVTTDTSFSDSSLMSLLVPQTVYTWSVMVTDGFDSVLSAQTFTFTTSDSVTGVAEQGKRVPKEYALHQNYPNPFNPSTTIEFDLPHQAVVTLEVYNLLGQRVATLIDHRSMDIGYLSMRWDASSIPSGVYLYRMSADGMDGKTFVQVKKMMLMR